MVFSKLTPQQLSCQLKYEQKPKLIGCLISISKPLFEMDQEWMDIPRTQNQNFYLFFIQKNNWEWWYHLDKIKFVSWKFNIGCNLFTLKIFSSETHAQITHQLTANGWYKTMKSKFTCQSKCVSWLIFYLFPIWICRGLNMGINFKVTFWISQSFIY